MKKYVCLIVASVVLMVTLVGCKKNICLQEKKIDVKEVNKIQIVLAKENPDLKAKSKVIKDSKEIKEFISVFNQATLGKEIAKQAVVTTNVSTYYLYSGDKLLKEFVFNGNDTTGILNNKAWYSVNYEGNTPYGLYEKSKALEFTIGADSDNLLDSQNNNKKVILPKISEDTNLGADLPTIDYESSNYVVFHNYLGLFVFDLKQEKMYRSLDLATIGCKPTQGGNQCLIRVNDNENKVILSKKSMSYMYEFNLKENTLSKVSVKKLDNSEFKVKGEFKTKNWLAKDLIYTLNGKSYKPLDNTNLN